MNTRIQMIASFFLIALSLCSYSSTGAVPVKVVHFNAEWLYGACPFTVKPTSYCPEIPWKTQSSRNAHIIAVAKYLKSEEADIIHLTEVQDQATLDKVVNYMNDGLEGAKYTGYIARDKLYYAMQRTEQRLFQKNALISRLPMFNLEGESKNKATRDYLPTDGPFNKYIMGQFLLHDRTVVLVTGVHFPAKNREFHVGDATQLVNKIKGRIAKLNSHNVNADKKDRIRVLPIVLGDFNNGDADLGESLLPEDADTSVITYIKNSLNLVNAAQEESDLKASHAVGMIDHILIPSTKKWRKPTVFSMPTAEEQPLSSDRSRISDHRALRVVLRAARKVAMPTIVEESVEPTIVEESVEPTTVEELVEPTIVEESVEPTTVEESVEPTTVEELVEPTTVEKRVEPVTEKMVELVVDPKAVLTTIVENETVDVQNDSVEPPTYRPMRSDSPVYVPSCLSRSPSTSDSMDVSKSHPMTPPPSYSSPPPSYSSPPPRYSSPPPRYSSPPPPMPYYYHDPYGNYVYILVDYMGRPVTRPILVRMSEHYARMTGQFSPPPYNENGSGIACH